MLSSKGLDVTIFDSARSAHILSDQKMILGDIRDKNLVAEIVPDFDYILNFAAIANLEEAKSNPMLASEVNIMGNLNVLEAMKAKPPKRYIFASTYYVYSEFGSVYRITKQACELYIEDYAKRFGIPYSVLRYGSLYGERADNRNTVYRLIQEAMKNKKIVRYGTGEEVREYIHVRDAARQTYDVMLDENFKDQHVILSGQQRYKIRELLSMIREIMGRDIEVEYRDIPRDDTDHYFSTPYTFRPRVAMRYSGPCHYDLGQGLLQLMYTIHEDSNISPHFPEATP